MLLMRGSVLHLKISAPTLSLLSISATFVARNMTRLPESTNENSRVNHRWCEHGRPLFQAYAEEVKDEAFVTDGILVTASESTTKASDYLPDFYFTKIHAYTASNLCEAPKAIIAATKVQFLPKKRKRS